MQEEFINDKSCPNSIPLSPPKIKLSEIRAVIPAHCFERSLFRSSLALVENSCIVGVLFFGMFYLDNHVLYALDTVYCNMIWIVYWFLQGVYCTGLWVLAHECGHQSFSNYKSVNDFVGTIIHSLLLVPYHSWRITHRRHHSNTGSCENDEVFVPQTKSERIQDGWNDALESTPAYIMFRVFMMCFVGWMPSYMIFNSLGPAKYKGKNANHLSPNAVMFTDKERDDVRNSI